MFIWIAIVVSKILQVLGTVNYVRNFCHLTALELQLSILGRSLNLLENVVYVAVVLVLSDSQLTFNGPVLFVLR